MDPDLNRLGEMKTRIGGLFTQPCVEASLIFGE
jgi:hypothetical protein